jgi:hypothetical protein
MAGVMNMIRFGGSQKYPVNARAQQRAQERVSTGLKAIENTPQGHFQGQEPRRAQR